MGVRAAETGVTLQFMDPTGQTETRPSVTGEYAFLFSTKRPEAPGDPLPIHGSQDWLTDIIVVDNPIKLINMQPTQTSIALSSASSKRVRVKWSVGNDTGEQDECFTIATGPPSGTEYLYADNIMVLPVGTIMDQNHYLWSSWAQQAAHLFATVQNRSSAPPKARRARKKRKK